MRLRRSRIEGYEQRPEGPRAISPCRCRTTGQRLGELANWNHIQLRTPACVAVGTFSKSAILQRFPNFYTLMVEIFRMCFIRSRLPMTPMDHEKFHGNQYARFREIRKTDTQTDRHGNFIYKVIYNFICKVGNKLPNKK